MAVWGALSVYSFLSMKTWLCEKRNNFELKFTYTLTMTISALTLHRVLDFCGRQYSATFRKAVNIFCGFNLFCLWVFSYLTSIKTKVRNDLITIEDEMHVCLCHIFGPELYVFTAKNKHQFHITHVNFILCCSNNVLIQI